MCAGEQDGNNEEAYIKLRDMQLTLQVVGKRVKKESVPSSFSILNPDETKDSLLVTRYCSLKSEIFKIKITLFLCARHESYLTWIMFRHAMYTYILQTQEYLQFF